jgi:hypothetical protein
MRLAHNKRLSGALGSCYGLCVDTENIFRCGERQSLGVTKPIAVALKAGFNAYLTKPIDFNKLERLLRKVEGESGFQILGASARWFKAACWSPRRVSGVLI